LKLTIILTSGVVAFGLICLAGYLLAYIPR
jgi:hypothetical protein